MNSIISTRPNYFKVILKFVGVGGAATVTHAMAYSFTLFVYPERAQLANLIGYLLAVFLSYFGQRKWTFGHVELQSEYLLKTKFILCSLFSLSLNAFWVFIVTDLLKINSQFSIMGIVLLTPAVTFLILKNWVFKSC